MFGRMTTTDKVITVIYIIIMLLCTSGGIAGIVIEHDVFSRYERVTGTVTHENVLRSRRSTSYVYSISFEAEGGIRGGISKTCSDRRYHISERVSGYYSPHNKKFYLDPPYGPYIVVLLIGVTFLPHTIGHVYRSLNRDDEKRCEAMSKITGGIVLVMVGIVCLIAPGAVKYGAFPTFIGGALSILTGSFAMNDIKNKYSSWY